MSTFSDNQNAPGIYLEKLWKPILETDSINTDKFKKIGFEMINLVDDISVPD